MGEAKRRRMAEVNRQVEPGKSHPDHFGLAMQELARIWDPDDQWDLLETLRSAEQKVRYADFLDRVEAAHSEKLGTATAVVRLDFALALEPRHKALYDELVDYVSDPAVWPIFGQGLRSGRFVGMTLLKMADALQAAFHGAWRKRIALFAEHEMYQRAEQAIEDYRSFRAREQGLAPIASGRTAAA